jgi:predicted metal-dependent phosphoesterase TrpH
MQTGRVWFRKPDYSFLRYHDYMMFDMHFHTIYSDGNSNVKTVMKKLKKTGIGIAITDHNDIRAPLELAREKAFFIPAIEVNCVEGRDVLIYFYNLSELQDFYTKNVMDFKLKGPFIRISKSMNDILDASKNYNCISCAAHPYGYLWKNLSKVTKNDVGLLNKFDSIEVFNGEMTKGKNIKAIELAASKNMPYTGGSDGHVIFNLGKVVTYSHANSVEEFLDNIKKQKNFITGTMTGKIHALTTHSEGARRHFAANMPRINLKDRIRSGMERIKPKINIRIDSFMEKRRRKNINRIIDRMKK